MLYKIVSIFACAFTLASAGCRDNGTLQPADLSGAGAAVDMAGTSGGGGDMTPKNYAALSIAMMRQGKPGDFELDNVVAIALTPSSRSPKLFVQDAAGGMFSAMETKCSASGSHPCSVVTTVATVAVGHSVTIKGTYIKSSGGFEEFYIDSITDNGAGTAPAPLTLTENDILVTVNKPENAFQMATVKPSEDLVMYDWTPATLKYMVSGTAMWPGCSTAPFVFGFGMIPASAGTASTMACTTKTMPAPSAAAANAKEILIGTDFYKSFPISSDCQCAKSPTTVPSATTKWPANTAMTGIVNFDSPVGGTAHTFFSPTSTALTNTVAPPTM